MAWCKKQEDLFRLATFVQTDIDPPDGPADAAYLFGHTKFFAKPILNAGATLCRSGKVAEIYILDLVPGYPIPNNDPGNFYQGFKVWRKRLVLRGVRGCQIHPVKSPRPEKPGDTIPVSHTGTEAFGFVALAKESGWKTVYAIAHPIHMLRAFTLMVTAAMRLGANLKIYAKAGHPAQPWYEQVVSSQGVVRGTRLEVMDAEWGRLNSVYGNKYDPLSAPEITEYIKRRCST